MNSNVLTIPQFEKDVKFSFVYSKTEKENISDDELRDILKFFDQ